MKRDVKSDEGAFGHSPRAIAAWRRRVVAAVRRGVAAPFYLFAPEPMQEALDELWRSFTRAGLAETMRGIPEEAPLRSREPSVRHWYSCKTQPVPAVLRWWRESGR